MRALAGIAIFVLLAGSSVSGAACPLQRADSFGDTLWDDARACALDPHGRLVVTGSFFTGTVTFPGLPSKSRICTLGYRFTKSPLSASGFPCACKSSFAAAIDSFE